MRVDPQGCRIKLGPKNFQTKQVMKIYNWRQVLQSSSITYATNFEGAILNIIELKQNCYKHT